MFLLDKEPKLVNIKNGEVDKIESKPNHVGITFGISDCFSPGISFNPVYTADNNLKGTGWRPDYPDLRDYTLETPSIQALDVYLPVINTLPKSVDLRQWCSPVEDQKNIGSCTAHAAMGIVEYFQKKSFGKYMDGSRLFVYKTTRNLLQETGDIGGFCRTAMGALRLFGVPDEKYWPYDTKKFDIEPNAFVYSLADNFEALQYYSIKGNTKQETAVLLKKELAKGIPFMFGFYGFDSFNSWVNYGEIPFPCAGETPKFGHAIMAVGYDDNKVIRNKKCNAEKIGAFLIRNSWGTDWGEAGFGWIPYAYVDHGLALDFWALISADWVDTEAFKA